MKIRKYLPLIALFTVSASLSVVGCGDDDDGDGGGGGGTGTGAAAGAGGGDTGGSGTGGGAGTGTGGGALTGICAPTCTDATVDDDCNAGLDPESAFGTWSCVEGFCSFEAKPCNDEAGADQNCGFLGIGACVLVADDQPEECKALICDPQDDPDPCALGGGTCTGNGVGEDADVYFCETDPVEPSCGEGIEEGDPCIIGGGLGEGGGGGQGGGSGVQQGVCTADGTCACGNDSQCGVDGTACQQQ
jgi:hypothetical protein